MRNTIAMGYRSTALIVILAFGVLFAALALVVPSPPATMEIRPSLTEDDVANITKADMEKKVAPMHVDRFLLYPRYIGHPLSLFFIFENGTHYYPNTGNTCTPTSSDPMPCGMSSELVDATKGHLTYIVDGCWQDSLVRNINHFIYAVDANSGEILWSEIDRQEIGACPVEPAGW